MALATGDLTTLSTAQAYLASSVPSQQIISGLITRMSRFILNEINRSTILPKVYSEYFNGSGTRALVLPNWPVLSLNSLYINGAAITQATLTANSIPYETFGWSFEAWNGVPPGIPAALQVSGGAFYYPGSNNIAVNYTAGYEVASEAGTIDSSLYRVTPVQPYGQWASDQGVTYSNGTALVAVSSSPNQGEYVPPSPDTTGVGYYQFNSADASAGVLLTYGFVPSDLEQVVLEMIAERAAYRTRPGVRSQMLASQESISYDNSGLSKFAQGVIDMYRSVLPPAMGVLV